MENIINITTAILLIAVLMAALIMLTVEIMVQNRITKILEILFQNTRNPLPRRRIMPPIIALILIILQIITERTTGIKFKRWADGTMKDTK